MDVLGTPGDSLLAAWYAGTRPPCQESLLQRAAGDRLVALRACDAVQELPDTDAKRRALDRISRTLRDWSLPSRGVKVLRWPRDLGGLATQALARARAALTEEGLRLWDWVRARTRVVQAPRRNHSAAWNHIQAAKASPMTELLRQGAGAHPPLGEEQRAMVRAKRYWKLPVLDSRPGAAPWGE